MLALGNKLYNFELPEKLKKTKNKYAKRNTIKELQEFLKTGIAPKPGSLIEIASK